jgi:hypothetical protein
MYNADFRNLYAAYSLALKTHNKTNLKRKYMNFVNNYGNSPNQTNQVLRARIRGFLAHKLQNKLNIHVNKINNLENLKNAVNKLNTTFRRKYNNDNHTTHQPIILGLLKKIRSMINANKTQVNKYRNLVKKFNPHLYPYRHIDLNNYD